MNRFVKKLKVAKQETAEITKMAFSGIGEGMKVAIGLAPVIVVLAVISRL